MESLSSLVNHLKETGVLYSPSIIKAFEKIDRKYFVPEELQNLSYEDEALPIGWGQTISQPFTIAFMLELLSPRGGDKILDVGSGSGFTTALLSGIAGFGGRVIGTEIVPELVALGKKNLARFNFTNAEIRQAGNILGLFEEAPYDKILVSASAKSMPEPLINQLKSGGIMVIPVGDDIWKIEKKSDGNTRTQKHSGFAFVPLIENNVSYAP